MFVCVWKMMCERLMIIHTFVWGCRYTKLKLQVNQDGKIPVKK